MVALSEAQQSCAELCRLEIEETAQDLRILRVRLLEFPACWIAPVQAIQSIPQDELQMFFRDCGFTEEMVQQIVELIEEGRPQIEELSTSILRRTWCLVIQILVFCKVMVLLVSAGFFVATLGYDKGSCQFSDFTNGTCQQGNVCNLQIAAWHSEGIAYANQFSPPVASSESGGLKSFETNGPFRCCNFAHQAAQENYIPQDGSVEALGLGVGYGSGTPCCNFYNAQTKVFCDNFGAIQQFSHCPTAPWDCRLKLGSDENGNVVVDELLVWEEPVYVLLLIVAGGILGLMLLVIACGCACRHSERLYACGLVIWRCCRYVQNKIGCCRRCRACCACLCSCLRRLRPGPSSEERQQQRRHAREEQERAREASFKNDLRRSQSFGNLDLTRSSWKNSMRRWSLLGSTPTPKEKEPPKAAKVHARPKRKVKKTRVERLRVREADEDETGGMRTSSSNAEDTSESERSSQASKSENLPVDEIKPWNIEDLVEEGRGEAYLRLALKYHPDKLPKAQRDAATALFQAIAAVYEELLKPFGGKLPKRVKTAVAAAAELGDTQELARLLRELPSRANEEDDVGVSPLMFAAKGGCIEAAELLLSSPAQLRSFPGFPGYGADVHCQTPFGWSVLVYAALSNQGPMVQWLVAKGARVTPHELELAAFGGYDRGLAPLLQLYADRIEEVRTEVLQHSLLHLACLGILNLPKGNPERYLACVDLLLDRGVPLEVPDKRGRTCLQLVAGHPNWEERGFEASPAHLALVARLCAAKADPSSPNEHGNSALSLARRRGLHRVEELLLKCGAANARMLRFCYADTRRATKNLQSMLRPIMTPMQPQRRPQIITQKFGLQDPFASTTTSFASGYDTRSSFGAGSMSSGFGSHVAPGGVMAQTFSEGFGLRPAGHHRKLPGERQRQKKRRAKDRVRGRGVHLAGAQTRTAWGGDDLQQKPGTFRRRHSEQ
ncbi:unnamed protein product [Symbiodinium natans]|uniref:Uncharacterized protein n=1 Tax=Symbiodinium natans TaxID=878477 RepID=A0A812TBQ8_9DINO|nr:unnamed protein product [Symbiodinium natans]